MVIVNKILNVLIFLLAIAACFAAILLHQRRLELRSRADFMQDTMVQVAQNLDGTEGTSTDINAGNVITKEQLGWERYHKSRKWDEANQKYIFTDWEEQVSKLPGYTLQLTTLKEKMASKFDEIRASARFDLASMQTPEGNPVEDEDGNPYTPELFKEALNSVVSFDTMVELIPAKIERTGARGIILAQKIESISKAVSPNRAKSADDFDVYSDSQTNEDLEAELETVITEANSLFGRAAALASHYKTILKGFDANEEVENQIYFHPKFNPDDMKSEDLSVLQKAAETLAEDFSVVNKQLHELAVKTKELDKALAQIKRMGDTIEALNIENDDLKNDNGSLKAKNKNLSKQLEELKELYVKERNVMRPGFSAKIVEANDRFDFVVLNKGKKDGVKNNVEMVVHSDGTYVCKILVTKVLENSCVCDILPVTRPKDAQGNYVLPSEGDEAVVPGG